MNQAVSLSHIPVLSHVRRNHALEHATIQVLSERHRDLRVAGRSSLWGFYLYGQVGSEEVLAAAQEGLRRLRQGQSQMALHRNCGSNFVVAGTLAGLGAFLVIEGIAGRPKSWIERMARLPLACAAATLGIILAQPLGPIFQARVTTQADVGDLRIVSVTQENKAGLTIHHVRTEG
ncbi:MAG TPA: hypothetical protein ENN99_03225 [Chloroflexi bacterium]|nr:hypothetical protein [Chloroflexota bacterium]